MRKPWDKHYVVEPYEDPSFTCDKQGQATMRAAAAKKDWMVTLSLLGMLGAFVVMLGSGLMWFVPGLGIGALLFVGAALSSAMLVLAGRPPLRCSGCGQPMRIKWGPIPNQRDGEYQICLNCRTFVYNYRVSRE